MKRKRLLKGFFYVLIITLFSYSCINKIRIIKTYRSLLNDKSFSEIISNQKSSIGVLLKDTENLKNLNNYLEGEVNDNIHLQVSSLEKETEANIKELNNLNSILGDLIIKYAEESKELDKFILDGEVYIDNVPIINQYPKYPSGCESVSLLILLRYAKVNVTIEQITSNLNKADRPYYFNNQRYGKDPEDYFIGDPSSANGFGVYEKPIIKVASKIKPGIKNITGANLNDVLKVVIQGHPVQVWVSLDGISTYYAYSWVDETTGKIINYPAQFHSLVIIGFNKQQIITSDPFIGQIKFFDRYNFEKAYNFFGRRAIYYE
jgi:uncharacterized protein YvpB